MMNICRLVTVIKYNVYSQHIYYTNGYDICIHCTPCSLWCFNEHISENIMNVSPRSDDFVCIVITECYIWFWLIMEYASCASITHRWKCRCGMKVYHMENTQWSSKNAWMKLSFPLKPIEIHSMCRGNVW